MNTFTITKIDFEKHSIDALCDETVEARTADNELLFGGLPLRHWTRTGTNTYRFDIDEKCNLSYLSRGQVVRAY